MTMEHAIGTILILPEGVKVEVVRLKEVEGQHPCVGCYYDRDEYCLEPNHGCCRKNERTDRENIIYKEITED